MSHTTQANFTKSVQRELALVKVQAEGSLQDAALGIVGVWSGRLLELGHDHFTAEISGDPDKVTRFIAALAPFGLIDSFRSGVISLEKR